MTRNFEILQDKQIQFRKENCFLLKSQINEGEEMRGADEIVREWGTERVVINEEREGERREIRGRKERVKETERKEG